MYWILAPDTSSFSVYRHGLGDVLSVSGITAAQNGLHHNNPWLHLTSSPNLDLLEAQIQWVHAWCQRDFFLSRKKEFLGYCLNYTAPFLSHAILLDSYSPSSQWTPLTTNKKLLTFKFKIQADGKFFFLQPFAPLPMQRKIASLSSSLNLITILWYWQVTAMMFRQSRFYQTHRKQLAIQLLSSAARISPESIIYLGKHFVRLIGKNRDTRQNWFNGHLNHNHIQIRVD